MHGCIVAMRRANATEPRSKSKLVIVLVLVLVVVVAVAVLGIVVVGVVPHVRMADSFSHNPGHQRECSHWWSRGLRAVEHVAMANEVPGTSPLDPSNHSEGSIWSGNKPVGRHDRQTDRWGLGPLRWATAKPIIYKELSPITGFFGLVHSRSFIYGIMRICQVSLKLTTTLSSSPPLENLRPHLQELWCSQSHDYYVHAQQGPVLGP